MITSKRIWIGCVAIALASASVWAEEVALGKRAVELRMTATIEKLPESAKVVDLWMPMAQDTDGQRVTKAEVTCPGGGEIGIEPRYGNKMWHRRFEAPVDAVVCNGVFGAESVFHIERTEIVVKEAKELAPSPKTKSNLFAYLEPNLLIPSGLPKIESIAQSLMLESDPPIVAGRKIYDWLIDEFTYNYRALGAGQGDVRWACDSKTGDCSDYHSMFLALCRSQGIPADHEFGFPIRTKASEGKILFYHCWARFQVEGVGWIPLDASEADKHPELREYNFGSQSEDLLKFTHGRDVTLVPTQAGPPLNKFIYPYVEVDGQPHKDVKWSVTFKDLLQ